MRVSSRRRTVAPAVLLAASLGLAGFGAVAIGPFPAAAETGAAVLTVTGDIDGCAKGEDTAEVAAKIAGPIATVGDNAYPEATADALRRCYGTTWGPLKDRTHPVAGNHDYDVSKAGPYYDYFGAAAGDPGRGWYSYDVGAWHVVALNSNCDNVDCDQESRWLETDLQAHPTPCILAYWHHPRFTSGTSGGDGSVGAFWKVLYSHGASVVLNGHDHDYERFAPQDPSGRRDPDRGIREFVVGTGGASLGSLGSAAPNSEVRNNQAYGVLQMTLRPDGYDWRFVPVAGDNFSDSGSGACHGTAAAPPAPPTTVAPASPPVEEETSEPSTAPPADTPPGPALAGSEPETPSSDPAISRRRPPNRTPATTPAPSRAVAPPRPTAPAPTPTAPADIWVPEPIVTIPVADVPAPAAPPAEPASAAPPADEEAGPPGDSTALAMAISGLVKPAPPPHPDRRAVTSVALVLLMANAGALAAFYRRGAFRFSG